MQKFLFDKEIINNQLSVLNNTLVSQRQTKKTLLSHLEKFSDAMYENFNSDNTDSLLSLINEAHSIFECIKSNISKNIELKKFLENISNSDFLNTIDSEKFNNDFNILLENISKTNSSYLTFMNNYEKFINPAPINKTEEKKELKETDESIENEENIEVSEIEKNSDNSSTIEIENDTLNQEESLFNTLNTPEDINDEKDIEIASTKNEIIIEENAIEFIEKETFQEEVTEIVPEKQQDEIIPEETVEPEIVESTTVDKIEEIPEVIENNKKNSAKDFTIIEDHEEHIDDIKPSTNLPEKELIIDKNSGIAILPYSISDLDELFLDDPEKYSSIQDIIDQEYTVSLRDFENSSFTRYKEAFKLAKDKSNYSFSQAANFAKKFLVENEITSLIIASCKNVEELEFYIECLNNNKLEDFHHFKIIEK